MSRADDFPTIAVIQDIDGRVGYGAYWGEVQSTIHKALGSIGCVTNGSFRDLDMWAAGLPDDRRARRPEPRLGAHGRRSASR